jgi:hypothetical protein
MDAESSFWTSSRLLDTVRCSTPSGLDQIFNMHLKIFIVTRFETGYTLHPSLKCLEAVLKDAVWFLFCLQVNRHNIEKLRQRVLNGMTKHPGANFVCFPDGGKW